MLIICRKTLSVSHLLGLYLNHRSYLIRYFINSMKEWQWVPNLDLNLSMIFFFFMKKLGFKIVLFNLYPLSIEDSYRFAKNNTLKNFELFNRQHKNIRFTSEIENENSVSFLDIKISRDNNEFTTSVTTKQTLAECLPTLKV